MAKVNFTTFLVMRHGQSMADLDGRFEGWLDCALTDKGLAQARRASWNISLRCPWTSPNTARCFIGFVRFISGGVFSRDRAAALPANSSPLYRPTAASKSHRRPREPTP